MGLCEFLASLVYMVVTKEESHFKRLVELDLVEHLIKALRKTRSQCQTRLRPFLKQILKRTVESDGGPVLQCIKHAVWI